MNTRVHASRLTALGVQSFLTGKQRLFTFCLTLLVFVSALCVVLTSDQYRMRMLEQEQVVLSHQVLLQNNRALRLKAATTRAQARVAKHAKSLGMYVPTKKETVWLTMHDVIPPGKE